MNMVNAGNLSHSSAGCALNQLSIEAPAIEKSDPWHPPGTSNLEPDNDLKTMLSDILAATAEWQRSAVGSPAEVAAGWLALHYLSSARGPTRPSARRPGAITGRFRECQREAENCGRAQNHAIQNFFYFDLL